MEQRIKELIAEMRTLIQQADDIAKRYPVLQAELESLQARIGPARG